MRDTMQRRMVLNAACELCHPSADEVYKKVVLLKPGISRRTVYRNLNDLAEERKLQKIHMPDGADCYDSTLTPHHHIRCEDCGRIYDVDMPAVYNLTERIRDAHGFKIHGYDVVFTGICPACQNRMEKEETKDE